MRKGAIIFGIVLIIALALSVTYSKAKALIKIFEKITMEPVKISKLNVAISRISFNIDILLQNPSPEAFSVNGLGVATLKEISIFYKGVFIAKSFVNMTEISIPANDQLIIPNIPVVVEKPLQLLANNLVMAYDMVYNFDVNHITTSGIIDVAGYEINI